MENANDLMTVWMVAQEKQVHVKSVYRAIYEERLPSERLGKTVMLRRRDVAAWNPRRL